jgi:NAD(P)H-nitrite reductase large subunit
MLDAKLIALSQDLDAGRKIVSLNDGTSVKFNKILLATGSSPVLPDIPLPASPFIQTYRSVRLRPMASHISCTS